MKPFFGVELIQWLWHVIQNHCFYIHDIDLYILSLYFSGAPEGLLDRCAYVRVGTERVPMTRALNAEIMKCCRSYGTGRDTLRCLALATIDNPMKKEEMKLDDSTQFFKYEVCITKSIVMHIKNKTKTILNPGMQIKGLRLPNPNHLFLM